jgi:hypothetical protein
VHLPPGAAQSLCASLFTTQRQAAALLALAGMPPENDVTHCWGDSCYFYFSALNFGTAKQKCANISAAMFSPNSQAEQLEVESYFWTTKYMADYWLGLERQNNRYVCLQSARVHMQQFVCCNVSSCVDCDGLKLR